MPLPSPQPRRHLHTRRTEFQGFLREDGLWDIEGHLSDTKTYGFLSSERGDLPPGEPIHGMWVRLTVDEDMRIVQAVARMDHTPYGHCVSAEPSLNGLVGETLGPGWRKTIARVMGGEAGCTHLRELLFATATAAYQTIWPWREHERLQRGQERADADRPPPHLGQCITWAWNSPVTQRREPGFYRADAPDGTPPDPRAQTPTAVK